MTRSELLDRVRQAHRSENLTVTRNLLSELAADIEADGVLDVQCPEEIAEDLDLPRPAK